MGESMVLDTAPASPPAPLSPSQARPEDRRLRWGGGGGSGGILEGFLEEEVMSWENRVGGAIGGWRLGEKKEGHSVLRKQEIWPGGMRSLCGPWCMRDIIPTNRTTWTRCPYSYKNTTFQTHSGRVRKPEKTSNY